MNIYKEAVSLFGKDARLDMAMEECAELIQAISKIKRKKGSVENLIEEIVDVEIMIEQLKFMFPHITLYEETRIAKLRRLEDLVNEHNKRTQSGWSASLF